MREIPNTVSVSIIMLAVALSVIFTVGIIQNYPAGSSAPEGSSMGASGGEISLTFTTPKVVEDGSNGEVSLTILPAGG